MARGRRILLTGWTGFIGRRVFSLLCERMSPRDRLYCLGRGRVDEAVQRLPSGARVRFLRCDLTDPGRLARAVALADPVSHVVHLAAVSVQDADPMDTLRANALATAGLAAVVSPYAHFLFASSAAVFGDALADAPREDWPHAPTTVYGASKSLAEAALRGTRKKLLVVRPIAQVGPGATHGLLRDIVAKLRSESPSLELRGGEPGSAKPFAHADDTAAKLVELSFDAVTGTLHLAPDDCMTVARVARVAMEELGISKPLRWLGAGSTYKGDQSVVRLTPSRGCNLRPSEEAVRMALKEM